MERLSSMKIGLAVLLVAIVTGQATAAGCGGNITATSGKFSFAVTANTTLCKWYIIAENVTQMTLHFNSLVLGSSNLTILSGNDSTSPPIVQYTKYSGTVTVVSNGKITPIVLSKGADDTTAKFAVDYDTQKCLVKFSGQRGVINSPVYRANSGDVKCSYEIALPNNVDVPVMSFPIWTWSGAVLNVTFGSGNAATVGSSDDVLGPAGAQTVSLSMQINNGSVQQFQTVYQTADKSCSGTYTTNSNGTVGTLKLPKSNTLPIQCYAQIVSADTTKQIYVSNNGTGSSVAGGDSVLLLDGASSAAAVIGSLSKGSPWFVSSSNKVTLVASLGTKTSRTNALNYKEDAFSKLYRLSETTPTVNVTLKGADVKGAGVWIQVQSKSSVKVTFDAGTSLADTNTTVAVQDSTAKTLYVFSKDTVMFPVNSPVGGALIVVKGWKAAKELKMTISQSASTDCNQLYAGASGMISSQLNENSTAGCVTVLATGLKDSSTILQLDAVTLCPDSAVEIYEGTSPSAAKLGTIKSTDSGSSLPQIQFPAGSQPRLLWSKVDTSCKTQSLTAKYWSVKSVCGTLGTEMTGSVKSPNFPNQYPLNAQCTWPVTAKNKTMLYLSANTVQFGKDHSLTLMKDNKDQLAKYSGNTLPNDLIVPNENLSMVFTSKTKDSGQLDTPGQGVDITYKILTCGGSISDPSKVVANPNVTSAVECIWIIQVPAKEPNGTVNIVSANFSVTGYNQSTSTKLEVRDGGSVRAELLNVDLKKAKIPLILSRYNFLWVRYVSNAASNAGKSFNFTLKYSVYNCNKSSLCDNGICLHPDWRCDGNDQCGDNTDERHCNGTQPIPTPTPAPQPHGDDKKGGVSAYWVVICLILGILIGVAIVFIIPRIVRKTRLRNYHTFTNTENA